MGEVSEREVKMDALKSRARAAEKQVGVERSSSKKDEEVIALLKKQMVSVKKFAKSVDSKLTTKKGGSFTHKVHAQLKADVSSVDRLLRRERSREKEDRKEKLIYDHDDMVIEHPKQIT